MLANIQTALMWIGGVTLLCLALLPLLFLFSSPRDSEAEWEGGDTTGMDKP